MLNFQRPTTARKIAPIGAVMLFCSRGIEALATTFEQKAGPKFMRATTVSLLKLLFCQLQLLVFFEKLLCHCVEHCRKL